MTKPSVPVTTVRIAPVNVAVSTAIAVGTIAGITAVAGAINRIDIVKKLKK
jgi:hypothetical protein